MPKFSKKTLREVSSPSNTLNPHFFTLIILSLIGIALAQFFVFRSTIRIGLNLELSGEYASIGEASAHGAQLAVDQLNAAGGISHNGRKYRVELFTENNNSDPNTATTIVSQLIDQNVHALIGPNINTLATSSATQAETLQMLMISPQSSDPQTTQNVTYIFRTTFTDPVEIQALVRYANFDLKATRVAILYDDQNPVFQDQANLFRNEFQSWGGEVIAFNPLPTNETDLTNQLNTIKRLNPHVIFLPADQDHSVSILSKAKELGLQSIFLGTRAWSAESLALSCGDTCQETHLSAHFSTQSESDKLTQFVTEYRNKYTHSPRDSAALSYDAVQMLAIAISQAENLDTLSIAKSLQTIQNYDGVTGNISYSTTSNDPFRSVHILKIAKGEYLRIKTLLH